MPKISLTPYQRHKACWSNCTRCELSERRRTVVLLRGSVPCDVLFVGEAPGEGEDRLGKPFVGPAGKLLDQIIEQASYGLHLDGRPFRFAWTNLVACIPLDDEGDKTREPPKEAIEACRPRLVEAVRFLKPRLVVTVGSLAEKHYRPEEGVKTLGLMHPAAILRGDFGNRGLLVERCVSRLGTELAEIAD